MRTRLLLSLTLAAAALASLPACSSDDDEGVPVVMVAGQAQVVLGGTTQLTAATVNGTDSAYLWTTSNSLVATVSATGLVTAVSIGECRINAVGNQTAAAGTMSVVVTVDPSIAVPNYAAWLGSPHADQTAEAFRHWDEDGEVDAACARCHSTPGFQDFLGADGSAEGSVEQPAPLGTTVECEACHNPKTEVLSAVTFPSGVEITGLGKEAICMQCHQGRESTDSIDDAIAAVMPPPADDDSVLPDRGFINIHYFPAGATRYGGQVRGGYLYDGKSYDVLFKHVPDYVNCQDCHDMHTLEIRLEECAKCHNVSTKSDLYDIRMDSSLTRDYDGDGDLVEGLWHEVDGLRTMLLTTMQNYGREVVMKPVAYDDTTYPYFYNDLNDNGEVDDNERGSSNRYRSFTTRTLKASFNLQYAFKDPGGFAHNGKFIIQMLHDSIADMNAAPALTTKTDLSNADRTDSGHFDGTAEAFRHWDDGGEVEAGCVRCHSGSEGYDEFLTYEAATPKDIANGMDCATCHTTFDTFETKRITSVTFPSGYSTPPIAPNVPTDDHRVKSNMCIQCHQGRVSKKDIDEAIANNKLGFLNIHYLAAGATLYGSEATMGYEYPGKVYAGRFEHASPTTTTNNCSFCHDPRINKHSFLPQDTLELCRECHVLPTNSVYDIRVGSTLDYNGNGSTTEPLKDELKSFSDALYAELQAASGDTLVYSDAAYPYFFKDTNGNGVADPGEINFGNRFTAWTPALMKGAHNYQHSLKEPGAWAHNFAYICQLCYDSIEDLGGTPGPGGLGFTRP